MALPTLWRTPRGGQLIGAFHVTIKGKRINLRTKDADEAARRRKLALAGRRAFTNDASMKPAPRARAAATSDGSDGNEVADKLIAALDADTSVFPQETGKPPQPAPDDLSAAQGSATGAPEVPPSPPQPESRPDAAVTGPVKGTEGWADDVRAAAGSADAGPPPPPPPIDPQMANEEIAKLAVEGQLWVATTYARRKVWKKFNPPQVPQEARTPLEEQWVKVLSYCNVSSFLPPWVFGLVVPIGTLLASTLSLAHAFADLADEQRRRAGEPPQAAPQQPEQPRADA